MNATAEKYLMLLSKFGPLAEKGSEIVVSTDELALAWYCSTRNAKLITHKLVEEGLISWHSGRGRGHVSKLTFLADKDSLLLVWAQEMARKGDYKQAFELLQRNSYGTALTDRFAHWLNDHFGYQAEATSGVESADTLRFPVYVPIITMDPSQVYCAFDAHMIRQVFDRLVEYDPRTCEIVPSLAHSWESNASATIWTFHLRKGIRFPNGRELQSEDVRFTLERMRGDKAHSWLVRSLKEVQCISARTVRILLNEPNYIFLRFASSAGMSIVPHDLIAADETAYWRQPAGTGPFRISNWTADCCDLVANPDYFQGRAHLDRIVIAFMPAETAQLGEDAPWQQMIRDEELIGLNKVETWNTHEALSHGTSLITWNMGKEGAHQKYGVRKAMELLINRQKMIRELGEDRIYPSRGFRPTKQTPFLEEEMDIEEARRLLRESGYAGEEIVICSKGSLLADADWIQKRCSEFGINIRIRRETTLSVRAPDLLSEIDGILFCVVFAVEEVCEIENYEQAGNFLREHLHPEVREWAMEQVSSTLASDSAQRRRTLLNGIEERLREQSHVLFLTHRKQNAYVHETVKGVGLNQLGWMDFKNIWLENEAASFNVPEDETTMISRS